MELEKQRLKQEEDERLNRLLIENKIKDFEAGWIVKFDAHMDAVSILSNRLIHAENEVKCFKELSAKKKVSDVPDVTDVPDVPDVTDVPECVPNDLSMSSQ